MLNPALTPTRLIDPARREPISIIVPAPPARLRTLFLAAGFLRLLGALLLLGLGRRLTREETARRTRALFERMGGLWIKAGQLLALRIDIFPQELCTELAKLQSRATGFPGPLARAIVERELGAPIEQYFDEFDEKPFAVASIGQVHRAHLRQEGMYVAVKVQKPYVDGLFQKDLVFMRWCVRLLELLRFYPHMRWQEGLNELREVMNEELDFHFEASNIRRMRRNLHGHKIYVPRLFSRYCTRRVLVTEFIHAVLMADYLRLSDEDPEALARWLLINHVDPRRVAKRLIHSIFRQMFENNLYHGDLHPGNIVLLRNSRIALIDFGTTNFTEREYLTKFRLFVAALATRDYAKAADLCFMLCASLPVIDLEQVKEKMIRALRAWATRTLVRELPYHEKSLDNATVEVIKVLFEFRCTMEWAWLRIHRALTTLDASLIYLYPDVNYTKMLQRYFEKAEMRHLQGMASTDMLRRSLKAYGTALDIQDRVNEYTMFQGALIRRHAQVFQGATNKFAAILAALIAQLAFLLLVAGALAFILFLEQHHPAFVPALLGRQLARLSQRVPPLDQSVWLGALAIDAYVYYNLVRLKMRLSQKDVRPHERVAAV
jgi:ubiquinone biosynthesis protein